ncbi:MAG: MBL fold metallo-hydrolase [Candidatus Shapirobacteria bacterium]|jgi:hypothetical protein
MEIRQIGQQTILLKGKKEGVVLDPDSQTNLGKINSRIVAFSNSKLDFLGIDSQRVVLKGPGEYEVGGVEIGGYSAGGKDTVYVFTIDGVTVATVGLLSETLTDKRRDRIESVDVLVVKLADEQKATDKEILSWVKKWGANYLVVIDGDQEKKNLKRFLDSCDVEGQEAVDSLKVDKDELPDGMEVVILKES